MIVVSTAFEAVETLRRALAPAFTLQRCTTVAQAEVTLATLGGPAGCAGLLLEPTDAADRPTAPLARAARAVQPSLPVIALARRTARWCTATLALLELPPTMVTVAEDLDLGSVRRALGDRLRDADFVARVWGELEGDVPGPLQPLLRFALERSARPLTVQSLADAMGLHRKTLWSRCRRHGVDHPQELVTWCRLLAAEHALRECARPVDAVADDLAFASPTALRNAIRRHVGTTPSALRAPDAPRAVSDGFRAWMRGRTRDAGVDVVAAAPEETEAVATPVASVSAPPGVTWSDVA